MVPRATRSNATDQRRRDAFSVPASGRVRQGPPVPTPPIEGLAHAPAKLGEGPSTGRSGQVWRVATFPGSSVQCVRLMSGLARGASGSATVSCLEVAFGDDLTSPIRYSWGGFCSFPFSVAGSFRVRLGSDQVAPRARLVNGRLATVLLHQGGQTVVGKSAGGLSSPIAKTPDTAASNPSMRS